MKPKLLSLGIDMAAQSFTACLSHDPGNAAHGPRTLSNDMDGFQLLAAWLHECGADPETLIVCLESTGVYGEALCYYLHDKGYPLAVEHPLKVKRAFDVDGHKTDAVDSLQIAEYALRFQDELSPWHPREEIVEQIRILLSTREQLVGQRTRCQNSLKALSRKVVKSKMSDRILRRNVNSLTKDIKALDKEIERLIDQHPPIRQITDCVKSIPGVGSLLAANLLVISNGFQREMQPRELASYMKICPYRYESGTSVFRNPRSRKYGPGKLRKLIYLASRSVVTHREEFKGYYLRKQAEGKAKRLVLNNVANKLVKIICAVIREQKPYIQGYQSTNPRYVKTA